MVVLDTHLRPIIAGPNDGGSLLVTCASRPGAKLNWSVVARKSDMARAPDIPEPVTALCFRFSFALLEKGFCFSEQFMARTAAAHLLFNGMVAVSSTFPSCLLAKIQALRRSVLLGRRIYAISWCLRSSSRA